MICQNKIVVQSAVAIPLAFLLAHGVLGDETIVIGSRVVNAMAISPDSKSIALADRGEVRVCRLHDQTVTARFTPRRDVVRALAFADDGKSLRAVGTMRHDGTLVYSTDVDRWDIAGNRLIEAQSIEGRFSALSNDGSTLVTMPNPRGDAVRVTHLISKETVTLKGHRPRVEAVALSAHGDLIAVSYHDDDHRGKIKVWDSRTGRDRVTIAFRGVVPTRLFFSPDGKQVFTGGRFFDASTGRQTGWVPSATARAISPDGKLLGGMHDDGVALRRVDGVEGELADPDDFVVKTFRTPPGSWETMQFSPDGRFLAVGGAGGIRVWPVPVLESR